ncbi:hypothetical protein DRO22_01970 [Candidatus Bathyarchaeota archaeon]|nr:MAG: hypothetical protein DRO22_01970 [Candidatus Bathyarchaeota archaeon]
MERIRDHKLRLRHRSPRIIIPFVNTKEDVLKAIKYATYPPRGMRSLGPVRVSLRDPEYVETYDEEILILPQIETREGLENVDGIFLRRQDRSLLRRLKRSFKIPRIWRQWNHPKFEEAIQRILDAAEETGTVPGILAPIEEAYKTIKRGFKIINIGRDVGFLKQAAAQELQKARSHPKDMDT